MSAKKREASPSNGVPDDRVPVGWISVPLREVITPSSLKVEPKDASDQPYVGLEHIEAQTTRLLGHGRARDVRSTKSVFREGDVLYGKLRPYLSKVCLAPFDGIASTDILVFPKVPYVPSDYLMRFLSQTQVAEFANQHSAGTQLPRISFSALGELPFPLPPLVEQRRIMDVLETLLGRINSCRDRLERVSGILPRFRQAVLAAACSGRLTEDWRSLSNDATGAEDASEHLHALHSAARTGERRNAAIPTHEAHDLDPSTLPDSWTVVELMWLCIPERPITYGILKPGPDRQNGVPYVRVVDFADDRLRTEGIRRTSTEIAQVYRRSILRPGDILFRSGEPSVASAGFQGSWTGRISHRTPRGFRSTRR